MRGERDVEKLRRWCVRRLLEGWSIRDVSAHATMPRSTVHDWWIRFQRKGWAGLVDESRRPRVIHRLPQEPVARVVEVRRREGWCSETIAAYLKRQEIQVSSGSVHSILKQNQLITKPYKPRRQRTYIRFQREHPDSLWQTDIKYYGNRYLIAFLDDHSRFIPGSRIHHNSTAENAIDLLEECVKKYGSPQQILTDRGAQFYPARGGISEFTRFCTRNGIQHIVTSVRRPSTIGKIEAFHKAYVYEACIYPTHQAFVNYWNYERPHQGIGYLYPADVYFRDLRDRS